MAKHNATGRKRDVDRFTNIPNAVLAHAAVRTLQPSAFMTLIYLAMRCYGAKSNGHIVYSNRSGCLWFNPERKAWEEIPVGGAIGMSKSTVGESLRDLERRGLIVCTKTSTFDQKRLAKEYRLTWVRTETEAATNDYLAFKPVPANSEARPTHRPVSISIGRPTGSTAPENIPKGQLQADPPAYSNPHRPTHRPRCNQSSRSSDPMDVAMQKIRAALEPAAAEPADLAERQRPLRRAEVPT